MKNLVIVESPTKAKTIKGFLGKDYKVESSFGHIRDLPKSKLGIDVDNNYELSYEVPVKAAKVVKKLKELAKKAETIYFATDEDREGEAISWHLKILLNASDKKSKRIVFHEITKKAILEAINNPRELNIDLVDAQQARRALDRLVGYKLSPLLWKKVARGLSAGRVQSVAVRLIVEREKEIRKFNPEEYWTVEGLAKKGEEFKVHLHSKNNKKIAKFDLQDKEANKATKEIKETDLIVNKITAREQKKSPLPPFITSTLQQDANRRFGYSAKQTMMLAQQLYEGLNIGKKGNTGLITYMRTDSYSLSDTFVNEATNYIEKKLGNEYIEKGRVFKKKSKTAQEAHEAIRPTEAQNDPESLAQYLDPKQLKVYTLIWQRAVASQMTQSITEATTVDIEAKDTIWTLRASGSVMVFLGWQAIYHSKKEDNVLPELKENDKLKLKNLEALQHFTAPPARYSEAGLVKAMEELEIGRPSTYAPTIATIIARKYVEKEEKRLAPTEIGEIVNNLLKEHFKDIVDYNFTAKLEGDLDKVAIGEEKWQPLLNNFYKPFIKNIKMKEKELDKKEITEEKTDEICDKCQSGMIIKLGRFGKFLACSNYPDCKNTKPLGDDGKIEEPEEIDEKCPKCSSAMIMKQGRFGKFLACSNYPDCKTTQNISKSLGVKCPQCKKGDIVEKRTRAGKTFYACDAYPDCEHAVWSKPTGDLCPECKQLLLHAAQDKIKCESCNFVK